MKIKTFIATYLLFLLILFSSVSIVSVYLTNSQVDMIKNKSAGQFQAIAHTLSRDIAMMWGRGDWHHPTFSEGVADRVRSYNIYYSNQNIQLTIRDFNFLDYDPPESELFFTHYADAGYRIIVRDFLPEPFDNFMLEYSWDATSDILGMRETQNILLITAMVFSVVAAIALYFILSSIFKPLNVIAGASREIAGGQFGKRIKVQGKNELAQVSVDFNQMAQRVEDQIASLEEEAKNKQQFVDNFAHEIRTPLTSIYGYAEYMHKAALSEEDIIESAAYIMDESRHMKNIANSLLELATLRDYEPMMTTISINALFHDVMQSMYQSTPESKVQLFFENDDDNNTIVGQEDLIKSLLLNLCNNAMKACDPNNGIIKVDAVKQQTSVKLTVTDNGCGISEKDLQKIFEPFYRLDKSRNRILASGGVGLGLTLCKRIVDVHNAQMTITSQLDKGTSVEIIFTTP
ncbi:MAG: HAMP domain-containing histidine kinase [Oscillospiraceae bacterium]|nr:HAMP domain-containing histidine kinase [Oscillospiraceae bacterium]